MLTRLSVHSVRFVWVFVMITVTWTVSTTTTWSAQEIGGLGKCTRAELEWDGGTGETWLRALPNGDWGHISTFGGAGDTRGLLNIINASAPYGAVYALGSNRNIYFNPRMVPEVAGGRLLYYYEHDDMRISSCSPAPPPFMGHHDCLRGGWTHLSGCEADATDGVHYGSGTSLANAGEDRDHAWVFEPGYGVRQRYPWRIMMAPLAEVDGGPDLVYFCQQFTLEPNNLPDYSRRFGYGFGFTSWDTTCYVMDATYRMTKRTETHQKDITVYPTGEWPPPLLGTTQVVFSSHSRMFERMLPTPSGSHYVLLASDDGLSARGHDETGDHGGSRATTVYRVALHLSLVTRATTAPLTFAFSPWVPVNTSPMSTLNIDFVVLASNITVVAWGVPSGAPSTLDISGQAAVVRAFGPDLSPITPEFTPYEYAHSSSHQHGIRLAPLGDEAPYSVFISWNDESSVFRVVGRVFSFADPTSTPFPRPESPILELVPFNEASLSPYSAPAFRPHISSQVPEALGVVTKYTGGAVLQNGFVSCTRPLTLTLDGPTCASLGSHPPFSMSCVAAAVAQRNSDHGASIVLPPGVWTGCLPAGIHVTAAIRIVGASSTSTVIDCQSSGRAFVIDGYAIEASEEVGIRHTTVITGITFANGYVDLGPGWGHAPTSITTGFASGLGPAPGPDPPLGGGCLAILGLASGSWLEIQDVVFDSCVMSGGLGGGGLFLFNVRDARLESVTFSGCGATAPFPDEQDTVYGGGLYLGFAPDVPLHPDDTVAQPRGVAMINVAISGNTVSASSGPSSFELPPNSVGGGGASLSSLPLDFPSLTLVNTSITNNVVVGPAGGVGGGLAVSNLALFLSVPDLVVTGNSVSTTSGTETGTGAGGGMYFNDCSLGATFPNAVVADNSVAGSGGGVAVLRASAGQATFTFVDSLLTGNVASGSGGSIAATAVSLVLTGGTTITHSSAGSQGGGAAFQVIAGAFSTLPSLVFDADSVIADSSAQFGGGLFVENGIAVLAGTLVDNHASVGGGGLTVAAGVVSIASTGRVVNNTAPSGSATFSCLFDPNCGAQVCGLAKSSDPTPRMLVSLQPGADPDLVYASNASHSGGGGGGIHATDAVTIEWLPAQPESGGEVETASTPVEGMSLLARDALGEPVLSGVDSFELVSRDTEVLVRILSRTCTFTPGSPTCSFSPDLSVYSVHPSVIGSPVRLAAVSRGLSECLDAGPPFSVTLKPCAEDEEIVESAGAFSCQATCGLGEYFFFALGDEQGVAVVGSRCAPCPAGSYMDVESHTLFSCKPVPPGFYAYAGASSITPCPRGALCPDGKAIFAAPGWWLPTGRASDNSSIVTFFQCTSTEACPGGPEYARCGKGHDSDTFLCNKCDLDDGYGPLAGRCIECETEAAVAFSFLGLIVGLACVVLLVIGVRSYRNLVRLHNSRIATLDAGQIPGAPPSRIKLLTLFKLALSHMQVLALVISLRSVSSSAVSSWLGMISTLASTSSEWLEATCVTPIPWKAKLYAAFLLPAIVVGASVGITLVLRLFPSSSRGARTVKQSHLLMLHISSLALFVVYPSVSKELLSVFHCRSFHGYSARLVADFDYECYSVDHIALLLVSSIWILLVVLFLPVFAILSVYRAAWDDERASEDDPLLRMAFFNFLVGDFARGREYWELVATWRKIFIMCVVIFESRSIHQLSLVLTAMTITLAFQGYTKPHNNPIYTRLEFVSYFALSSSVAAALLLDPGVDVSPAWKSFAEFIIIGTNLAYIVIVVFSGIAVTVLHTRAQRKVHDRTSDQTMVDAMVHLSSVSSDVDYSSSTVNSME